MHSGSSLWNPCQHITSFHEALEKTLESLKTDEEFYYVVGDVNLNVLGSV